MQRVHRSISKRWSEVTGALSSILGAALLGLLINAPFAVGEFLTRNLDPRTEFPFTLFIGLWIEMAILVYLLMSVFQSFRHGTATRQPFLLVIRLFVLGILAWAWTTLIIDQWPCFFLGGSGC